MVCCDDDDEIILSNKREDNQIAIKMHASSLADARWSQAREWDKTLIILIFMAAARANPKEREFYAQIEIFTRSRRLAGESIAIGMQYSMNEMSPMSSVEKNPTRSLPEALKPIKIRKKKNVTADWSQKSRCLFLFRLNYKQWTWKVFPGNFVSLKALKCSLHRMCWEEKLLNFNSISFLSFLYCYLLLLAHSQDLSWASELFSNEN